MAAMPLWPDEGVVGGSPGSSPCTSLPLDLSAESTQLWNDTDRELHADDRDARLGLAPEGARTRHTCLTALIAC